jgi:hypothetical protein
MAVPKSFAEVDDLLLERVFQPVADFLAGHAGWGCRAVAGFCVDVAAVAWIAARAPALGGTAALREPGAFAMAAALLGLGLVALVSLRVLFRRVARGRHGNPLRAVMQPHRAVALLLLLVRVAQVRMPQLADVADVVMLLFSVGALYLGACAEPPPVPRGGKLLAAAS